MSPLGNQFIFDAFICLVYPVHLSHAHFMIQSTMRRGLNQVHRMIRVVLHEGHLFIQYAVLPLDLIQLPLLCQFCLLFELQMAWGDRCGYLQLRPHLRESFLMQLMFYLDGLRVESSIVLLCLSGR
ncbi:hypothetical protein FGO68_gene12044 [Halteria grandinella]|uniref:Uncharacterized protein n=1 Tax=Halteria grandinella TaxID=5974 RepID=A0A8J8T134_HALGN|nr:hypothetical protein FGO68_gene12044 [Halteria grandinella]